MNVRHIARNRYVPRFTSGYTKKATRGRPCAHKRTKRG